MKGSRFQAIVEPCPDRAAAERRLEELRDHYRDATHVCWAWRLLSEPDPGEASSDAGEPSGTAGVPILSALRSEELCNVLGIVVRWYGGTKLGRGGLIRAYRGAVAEAIAAAEVIESIRRLALTVTIPVGRVGDIHRVLSSFEVSYHEQSVEEAVATIDIAIRADDLDRLRERISDASGGKGHLLLTDQEQKGCGTR